MTDARRAGASSLQSTSMICVVQRVSQASVTVDQRVVGQIADMRVSLDNDGPVTFLVDSREARGPAKPTSE